MIAQLFPDIGNLKGFPVLFVCSIEDGLSMANKDKIMVMGKFISKKVIVGGVGEGWQGSTADFEGGVNYLLTEKHLMNYNNL